MARILNFYAEAQMVKYSDQSTLLFKLCNSFHATKHLLIPQIYLVALVEGYFFVVSCIEMAMGRS